MQQLHINTLKKMPEDKTKRPHLTSNKFASKGKESWEKIYPRVPEGTKARIDLACQNENKADWMTNAILEKLKREGF